MSDTHKEKIERKKRLRAAANGNNSKWMLKSYKTETKPIKGLTVNRWHLPVAQQHEYGDPLPAAKRRVKQLNHPYDLSKHEDCKEIGYRYLEWVK
jgi:hypothetical protein